MARWKLWIDDTGAVDEGTYVRVEAAVTANISSTNETIEHPICEGDTTKVKEKSVSNYQITTQVKVKKGSAIEARLVAASEAGTPVGVLAATGDVTVAGAAAAGHLQLEMNALIEGMPISQSTTSTAVYDVTFSPHADNTDSSLPAFGVSTANP